MAAQTVQGNPEQPVTILIEWSAARPEWLPPVTVNQQVNHVTMRRHHHRVRDDHSTAAPKRRCTPMLDFGLPPSPLSWASAFTCFHDSNQDWRAECPPFWSVGKLVG